MGLTVRWGQGAISAIYGGDGSGAYYMETDPLRGGADFLGGNLARLENTHRATVRLVYFGLMDRFPGMRLLLPHLEVRTKTLKCRHWGQFPNVVLPRNSAKRDFPAGLLGATFFAVKNRLHPSSPEMQQIQAGDYSLQAVADPADRRLERLYFGTAPPFWKE